MDDTLSRFLGDLAGRITGPMTFRLILQPMMAGFMAWRDGVRDAREGRPPYLQSMLSSSQAERARLLREGIHAVLRVIVLGVVMEVIYQLIVFRWIYPGELVVVVLLLAFVPYVLVRGPVSRLARRRLAKEGGRA